MVLCIDQPLSQCTIVLDFLKNSKDESPDAKQALNYLTEAYLSANRNIRFFSTDNRLEMEGLESVPYAWPRRIESKDAKQDPDSARLRMLARHRELLEISHYLIVNKVIGRANEFEYMDSKTGKYIRHRVSSEPILFILSSVADWNRNFLSVAKANCKSEKTWFCFNKFFNFLNFQQLCM